VRYCVSHDNAECNHAAESTELQSVTKADETRDRDLLQSPLGYGDSDLTRLAKTMLHSRLERVCAAQFGVDDYQSNSPVNGDRKSDKKEDPGNETCLLESIWLSNDTSASALTSA